MTSDTDRLVPVLEADSEMQALTIQSFLQSQDIDAAVRSRQIPMYDGIAKIFNPVWGYVLVFEKDLEHASELIREYHESIQDIDGEETS